MNYEKEYKELYGYVELLLIQLDEKRANEVSLRDASYKYEDINYHETRSGAFRESVKDVEKVLNEVKNPSVAKGNKC